MLPLIFCMHHSHVKLAFPVAIWEHSLNLNTSVKWPHDSLLKDDSTGAIYCKATGIFCAIQVLQRVFSSCFILFIIFRVWKLFLLWTNFWVFFKYSLTLSDGWTWELAEENISSKYVKACSLLGRNEKEAVIHVWCLGKVRVVYPYLKVWICIPLDQEKVFNHQPQEVWYQDVNRHFPPLWE